MCASWRFQMKRAATGRPFRKALLSSRCSFRRRQGESYSDHHQYPRPHSYHLRPRHGVIDHDFVSRLPLLDAFHFVAFFGQKSGSSLHFGGIFGLVVGKVYVYFVFVGAISFMLTSSMIALL